MSIPSFDLGWIYVETKSPEMFIFLYNLATDEVSNTSQHLQVKNGATATIKGNGHTLTNIPLAVAKEVVLSLREQMVDAPSGVQVFFVNNAKKRRIDVVTANGHQLGYVSTKDRSFWPYMMWLARIVDGLKLPRNVIDRMWPDARDLSFLDINPVVARSTDESEDGLVPDAEATKDTRPESIDEVNTEGEDEVEDKTGEEE